ncbi:CoA ester lyase [Rhizorhabdus dicambivorans]|nr:CoA ester lyase [Rhizorhabdus dicambivorans]
MIKGRTPMLRRTTIFIPGTMDEAAIRSRISSCGADLICLDLEDTVHPSRKAEARELIVRLLAEDIWGRAARAVRINAMSGDFAEDDVRTVVGQAGQFIDTLLLSKPETVEEILRLDSWIEEIRADKGFANQIGYIVGIESAYALTNIDTLASCSPNVEALGFAIGDLSVSLHVNIGAYLQDRSKYPGDLFHFHRARIILSARTYGLWAMDAPWPIINDHATLSEDARWGMMMGFDGKLVLAPEQVRTVHEAYRPSEGEVAYARDVLVKMEAFNQAGEGSGMSGETFLDPVVIEPAKRTIARFEAPL